MADNNQYGKWSKAEKEQAWSPENMAGNSWFWKLIKPEPSPQPSPSAAAAEAAPSAAGAFGFEGAGAGAADVPPPQAQHASPIGAALLAPQPKPSPAPTPGPKMLPAKPRPGGGYFTPEPANVDPFMGQPLDPDGKIFGDGDKGKADKKKR